MANNPISGRHPSFMLAIVSRIRAGDSEADIAWDYDVDAETVRACLAWVQEHPGA